MAQFLQPFQNNNTKKGLKKFNRKKIKKGKNFPVNIGKENYNINLTQEMLNYPPLAIESNKSSYMVDLQSQAF